MVVTLRRDHWVFRQRFFFDGRPVRDGGAPDLGWIGPDGNPLTNEEWNAPWTQTLGMYLSGEGHHVPGDLLAPTDDSFLFLVHASDDEYDFVLPGEPFGSSYEVVFDTGTPRPADRLSSGATVRLTPRSCVLLRVAS